MKTRKERRQGALKRGRDEVEEEGQQELQYRVMDVGHPPMPFLKISEELDDTIRHYKRSRYQTDLRIITGRGNGSLGGRCLTKRHVKKYLSENDIVGRWVSKGGGR